MKTTLIARLLGGLLIALVLLTGCGLFPGGEVMTTITGKIVSASSGESIDSASIYLSDTAYSPMAFSDSLGNYTVVEYGYGEWIVYCGRDGYQTQMKVVYSSNSRRVISGLDFELERDSGMTE